MAITKELLDWNKTQPQAATPPPTTPAANLGRNLAELATAGEKAAAIAGNAVKMAGTSIQNFGEEAGRAYGQARPGVFGGVSPKDWNPNNAPGQPTVATPTAPPTSGPTVSPPPAQKQEATGRGLPFAGPGISTESPAARKAGLPQTWAGEQPSFNITQEGGVQVIRTKPGSFSDPYKWVTPAGVDVPSIEYDETYNPKTGVLVSRGPNSASVNAHSAAELRNSGVGGGTAGSGITNKDELGLAQYKLNVLKTQNEALRNERYDQNQQSKEAREAGKLRTAELGAVRERLVLPKFLGDAGYAEFGRIAAQNPDVDPATLEALAIRSLKPSTPEDQTIRILTEGGAFWSSSPKEEQVANATKVWAERLKALVKESKQ